MGFLFKTSKSFGPLSPRQLLAKLKAFTDNFTAADSALTLPQTSAKWEAISGTWGIIGNKAYSVTAGSSYPVAVVDTKTKDAIVKSTSTTATNAGHGVSFWVTDANNWWGAHSKKSTFTAAPYSCPSGGTLFGTTCTISSPAGGGPYGVTSCPGGGNPFGWGCFNCCWVFAYSATYSVQPAAYNCNAYPGRTLSGSQCVTSYAATATTYYRNQFEVVKKTAGTVSVVSTVEVANTTTATDYIAYVQANTQPASAIITAQMNTGGTVASYTATAGTPIRTNKHGMLTGPSTVSAHTSIESFEYTPN
jgi:hypothetical protein